MLDEKILDVVKYTKSFTVLYIEDNLDFYSYSIGENAGKEVVSFKIINESKCCYKNDIKITFQSIEREKKNISNIPESFRYLQFLKSIEN